MNWTGGALGRSCNANSSTNAIQKAHFAKTRGKPLTLHTSPPIFEVFGNVCVRARPKSGSPRHRSRSLVESQSRTNTFGLNEWMRKSSQDSVNSHINSTRTAGRIERARPRSSQPLQDATRSSPIIISSCPSSPSTFQEDGSISRTKRVEQARGLAARTIEAQRARLLGMRDWVGISHTKSAKVNFTDSSDRDQIGKRRRLSETNHRQSRSKRPKYKYESRSQQLRQNFFATNDQLSQADISVRIGSAVDRTSVRDERKGGPVSRIKHASVASEEMLLDEKYLDQLVRSPKPAYHYNDHHHDRGIYSSQSHVPERRLPLPPAFIDEPEICVSEIDLADDMEANDVSRNLQGDTSYTKQDLNSPKPTDKPVLMMRCPDEDVVPLRFEFTHTPRKHSMSSTPGSNGSHAHQAAHRYPDSHLPPTKTHGLRETLRRGSKNLDFTMEDSASGLRFFDTSPQTRQTTDYLAELQNRNFKPVKRDSQHEDNATASTEHEQDYGPKGMTVDDISIEHTDNLRASFTTEYCHHVLEDEIEGGERFDNSNPLEQRVQYRALPSGQAKATLDQAHQPSAVGNARAEGMVEHQTKHDAQAADEDEALWRSFVFGGETANQDWVVELEEEATVKVQNASSPDPTAQMESSMEAEVATSPIKQNAHLVEEPTSSSPAARTNGTSNIAVATSISQSNSDEMLDGGQEGSSSLHGFAVTQTTPLLGHLLHASHQPHQSSMRNAVHLQSSSRVAQSSLSFPPVTIDPPTSNAITSSTSLPSSLKVQPPTPAPVMQPSSDELAWSPARLSQSQSQCQTQPQLTAKPTIVFKKPMRYVGEHSSGPTKPVRLGGRAPSRPSKGRTTSQSDRPRGRGGEADIWEIGAERQAIAEIEDEIEDI